MVVQGLSQSVIVICKFNCVLDQKYMAPAVLEMAYLLFQQFDFVVILNLIHPYCVLSGLIGYSSAVHILNNNSCFNMVPKQFSGFS